MPNKTSSADLPWMTGKEIGEFRKEFTSPDSRKNVIYSKDICVSLDSKEGGPNLNSVVIGGSGSGKSVCVIVPNLLQADTSYVVTDPDGFLYEEYGSYLQYMGYHVKCLNLIDMDRSDCYNPFTYIQGDEDIEALVETLVKNAEIFQSQDLYYAKCESLLLCALVAYLHDHCRPEDQNFANVLRLLHDMHTDGDGPESFSPVDTLFEAVRKEDPDAYAVRQYDRFKLGAGKALKPVILAAALHLKMFDSEKVCRLTNTDSLHLENIPDEKTALFVIIPTGEITFNFLASLLCQQVFRMNIAYSTHTAALSQLVVDADGDVIKTFRADHADGVRDAREKAEAWLAMAQNARIRECAGLERTDGDGKKASRLFAIEAEDGDHATILGFRGGLEPAEEARDKLKHGRVIPNGHTRCPVHIRFLLDEFYRMERIAGFPEILPAINQYGMSVMMTLQSVDQLERTYEDGWERILEGCDTVAWIGAGVSNKTALWLAGRFGMSDTSKKGGGLFARRTSPMLGQLYAIPKTDCIVGVKGFHPYIGAKYPVGGHPEWKTAEGLVPYSYEYEKETAAVLGNVANDE